jgi:hypothetical protein
MSSHAKLDGDFLRRHTFSIIASPRVFRRTAWFGLLAPGETTAVRVRRKRQLGDGRFEERAIAQKIALDLVSILLQRDAH